MQPTTFETVRVMLLPRFSPKTLCVLRYFCSFVIVCPTLISFTGVQLFSVVLFLPLPVVNFWVCLPLVPSLISVLFQLAHFLIESVIRGLFFVFFLIPPQCSVFGFTTSHCGIIRGQLWQDKTDVPYYKGENCTIGRIIFNLFNICFLGCHCTINAYVYGVSWRQFITYF